ncbi:hypothetical protein [Gluconobacter aidae]|uniref:Uncharacterized protein n=1 Tax=Gluconobacter aidae TaxID=2662454 RepID=A0A7X1VPL2_9PROT|nr:hypothetical protein [Gluconobacter aidae]MQR99926.1 hypothetical protein [Gluconobacter aidae]
MLALFGVRPHRSKSFRLSTDLLFVDKAKDIVGLYLNPPDHAVALCVDEKTPIQALERTQPVLPLGLGYLESVTHDYVWRGTTPLFAALDIANSQILPGKINPSSRPITPERNHLSGPLQARSSLCKTTCRTGQ